MTHSIDINRDTRYKLNNGTEIPVIGFGVYDIPVEETAQRVYTALQEGYRHIDTAVVYENQKQAAQGVHRFLEETGVPREEVWFTTKLWNTQQGRDATPRALEEIAADVKEFIGYVDLLLLHSPLTDAQRRLETWAVLERAVQEPASSVLEIRAIGVSNFGVRHLQELLEVATVKPVVDQLELHPWLPRAELRAFLRENGVLAEAYSPLTQGVRLQDPELLALEAKSGLSKGEILLRWSFLQGFAVLVKSNNPQRIRDNLVVLPAKTDSWKVSLDQELWDALDKPDSHDVATWGQKDPTEYTV
ncbi:hypothetical protein ACU8KH_03531 [Lachancea thermotolerans]